MKIKEKLKRKKVGSVITAYERDENIFDPEHWQRALKGQLIKSELIVKPERSYQLVRDDIEKICRSEFAMNELPDPFSFVHASGEAADFNLSEAIRMGDEFIRTQSEIGYVMVAQYYMPEEDHSSLWYAARLAQQFARLDILSLKSLSEPWALQAAAQIGVEIGRLESEFRIKFDPEKKIEQKVQAREKQIDALARKNEGRDGHNKDRAEKADKRRQHVTKLLETIPDKHGKSWQAGEILRRWDSIGDDTDRPTAPAKKTIQNWLSEK